MKNNKKLYKQQTQNAKYHFDQGIIHLRDSNFIEAENEFKKGISADPLSLALIINLGISLAKQNKTLQAEKVYKRALKLNPNSLEALINLGDLYKYSKPKVARHYLDMALNLQPDNKNALDICGFTWFMEQKYDQALKYYEAAIRLDSDFKRALFHKTAIFFLTGKFDIAWENYITRYGATGNIGSPIGDKLPFFKGELNYSSKLLIWTDQGLGDEILQLGIIKEFVEKFPFEVSIITNVRLKEIVERSLPQVNFFSLTKSENNKYSISDFSYQAPAMSLAVHIKRDLNEKYKNDKYLVPCENKTRELRKKYLKISENKPLVGISWRSYHPEFGENKSIKLRFFMNKIIDLDCLFINLQYGDYESELNSLPSKFQSKLFTDLTINPKGKIDNFASQINALDFIITTSNSTAHLSGAIGKETITLVPKVGPGWLWYWFEERSSTPWYPKLKVLRQGQNNSWKNALNKSRIELSNFLNKRAMVTSN